MRPARRELERIRANYRVSPTAILVEGASREDAAAESRRNVVVADLLKAGFSDAETRRGPAAAGANGSRGLSWPAGSCSLRLWERSCCSKSCSALRVPAAEAAAAASSTERQDAGARDSASDESDPASCRSALLRAPLGGVRRGRIAPEQKRGEFRSRGGARSVAPEAGRTRRTPVQKKRVRARRVSNAGHERFDELAETAGGKSRAAPPSHMLRTGTAAFLEGADSSSAVTADQRRPVSSGLGETRQPLISEEVLRFVEPDFSNREHRGFTGWARFRLKEQVPP